ncbi:MAG: ATP-binding protein, partial [Gemmatimonadales bacterium]
VPDRVRFRAVIEPLVRRAGKPLHHPHVRAYGEMVDLLAKDGNSSASIRLEGFWNELVAEFDFDLLCGYALANFANASDALNFQEICRQHSHIAPTERYTQVNESERMREISRLQQRAHALETEVARRQTLELQLREALQEQERSLQAERIARTEAESANRAKNQFLAVMSHELRTPLNAIAGHAQLIELGLHGPVTSAQREALSRIERSQRHLLSLVNDVLNLARVDSGREEYTIDRVEITPLVGAIVSMIEPLLTSSQLSCGVTDQLRELPQVVVLADREKVQQILLNLLTNAIKFTPAGGRITIAAEVDRASNVAHIDVIDTGIGIPTEKIESVFEPFVQLATRRSTRQDGIGLGLTISRKFALAMKGDLTVRSRPGDGSRFRLSLPVAPAAI